MKSSSAFMAPAWVAEEEGTTCGRAEVLATWLLFACEKGNELVEAIVTVIVDNNLKHFTWAITKYSFLKYHVQIVSPPSLFASV